MRSTTHIHSSLGANFDWFERDLPGGNTHEKYVYLEGEYQKKYRALNAEINTAIHDARRFRALCLNVLQQSMHEMKTSFRREESSRWGQREDKSPELDDRKAFAALNIYCRFKYIIAQVDAGVPVATIVKPFATTKFGEQYKYDDQDAYIKVFSEIFKLYFDDEILQIISQVWPYTTSYYCPQEVHILFFDRFHVVPDISLQIKFLTRLVLPNFKKYVSTYGQWDLLLPSHQYPRDYKFNVINKDTMDCFLDPQSLGYTLLKERKDFVKYIDALKSQCKSLEEEAVFVTGFITKYPHAYPFWQQEWKEDCLRPSYDSYSPRRENLPTFLYKRLRLTQDNADFFFNPTKVGWGILEGNYIILEFVRNADKQLLAPLLIRYPNVINGLCKDMSFAAFIEFIRTLPPIYAKEKMDLIGGDNFTALLMTGHFRAIPIGKTLVPVFDQHREVASQMVYEAAASGDFARLQGLLNLSMDTTVQKDRHTATVSPLASKGDEIVHQSKVVRQQDTTEYREAINFNLNEFIKYLQHKFIFATEEQRPQLFFIQEAEAFVEKLIEHKKLKETDKERFQQAMAEKFKTASQPILSGSVVVNDGMADRLALVERENLELKGRLKKVEDMLNIILLSPAMKDLLISKQQDTPESGLSQKKF